MNKVNVVDPSIYSGERHGARGLLNSNCYLEFCHSSLTPWSFTSRGPGSILKSAVKSDI